MMYATSKYARGQIWYWSDPIYGPKSQGNSIAAGEGNIRYSRNVLIIQSTDSINGCAIVLPLSSSPFRPTDIEINIPFNGQPSCSYIRGNKIMSVNTAQLTRYICALSEEAMKMIDIALAYYLLPDIFKTGIGEMYDEFKQKIMLDHEKNMESKPMKEPATVIPVESIPVTDRKEDEETTDESPADSFPEQIINKRKKKHTQWDIERKRFFLTYLEHHSVQEAAEEFGIGASSIYKYRIKFQSELKNLPKDEKVVTASTVMEPVRPNNHLGIKNSRRCSAVSNYILEQLKLQSLHEYSDKFYLPDKPRIVDKGEFYKQCSCGIFYAYLNWSGIIETSDKRFRRLAEVPEEDFQTRFKYLEELETALQQSNPREALKSLGYGFDDSLQIQIRKQLTARLNLQETAIDSIIGIIKSIISP